MNLSLLFFILAAVCFGLGGFGVSVVVAKHSLNWTDLGLMCVVIGLWLVPGLGR